MSQRELQESHSAELASYLRYKKRVLESANFSDSDSSISEGEVKRRRKLNYFGGSGEKEWEPKTKLLINDLDVTKILNKFRTRNIILAEEVNNINAVRLLSLSHVFPVDMFNNNRRCITDYCENLKDELHKYSYRDIKVKPISMEAVCWCKAVSDNIDQRESIDGIEFSPKSTIDTHFKDAVSEFIKIAPEINMRSEATFMDKFIMPFIRKTLLKSANVVYSINDGFDKKSEKKPDVKIGFKDRQKSIDCVFFEVKRPSVSSKYQGEDDFVKLLKQLKSSLDAQVVLNISAPASYGVLCEGFDCTMYEMKLVEDGIYLATAIKNFRLPRNNSNLMDIIRVIECFYYLSVGLESLESRYKGRVKRKMTIEHEFVKKSFITEFV